MRFEYEVQILVKTTNKAIVKSIMEKIKDILEPLDIQQFDMNINFSVKAIDDYEEDF